MITTLIIITFLIFAAFYLWRNPPIITNGRGGKDLKIKPVIVAVAISLAGMIVSAIQPYEMERVKMGNVGLKVNLSGDKRGLSDYRYATGWTPYNTWTEELYKYETTIQNVHLAAQPVIMKGGFSATITPSFNYELKSDMVGNMFQKLPLPLKEIEQGWLKTAIIGSIMDEANKWQVDSVFNCREQFEAAIVTECNKRVSKWFNVSQLRTNIEPPPSLRQSIEETVKAIKEQQLEEKKRLTAITIQQRKMAEARGDSAYDVIQASGEAEAMKRKQLQLTPTYNDYLRIQKWDGKNSQYSLGGDGRTTVMVK